MRWKNLGVVGVAVLGAAAGTAGTFGSGEQVTFDPQTVTVGEGDGQAVVTVARSACERGQFRLMWRAPRTSTNRSTATAGEDYTSRFSNDNWEQCDGEGRRERVFTVPILEDDAVEGDETIQMQMWAERTSTLSTNPLPAVDPDGEILIKDNDELRLVASDVRVREADGVARVTVERRRGSTPDRGEPMSLSWQTTDGTARAGADYTATTDGDVEIAAGESRATVTVPLRRDDVAEADEDFGVGFSWGETQATATVTITDPREQRQEQQQGQASSGVPAIAISPRALQRTSAGPCVSKRRFTVRVRGVRNAAISIGGKRLATKRTRNGVSAVVDLRGRAKGRFRLRVSGETKAGKKVFQTRSYRTCTPKAR